MDTRRTNSKLVVDGRIDLQVHNISDLREEDDDYDSLSEKEKMELARGVEPEYEDTVYNVTTDGLHKYFVRNIDPDNTSADANVDIGWLGLGDNDSTAPQTSNTDLNNRTYSEPVTDVTDSGKDVKASTFLGSNEGNGNTFVEIGLFTGNPANLANSDVFLMNHTTFQDVTKDISKTIIFDVTLTFGDG